MKQFAKPLLAATFLATFCCFTIGHSQTATSDRLHIEGETRSKLHFTGTLNGDGGEEGKAQIVASLTRNTRKTDTSKNPSETYYARYLTGAVSGSFQIGGEIYRFRGKLVQANNWVGELTASNDAGVELALQIQALPDDTNTSRPEAAFGSLSGTVTLEDNTTKTLVFENTAIDSAYHSGRYTFLVEATTDAPVGIGYGALVIGKTGRYRAGWRTPDGMRFTRSSSLPEFYWEDGFDLDKVNRNRGSFQSSNINFTDPNSVSEGSGTAVWNRTARTSATRYPEGISDANCNITLSRYTRLTRDTNPFSLGAQVEFGDSGKESSSQNFRSISRSAIYLQGDDFNLKVNRRNGVVFGYIKERRRFRTVNVGTFRRNANTAPLYAKYHLANQLRVPQGAVRVLSSTVVSGRTRITMRYGRYIYLYYVSANGIASVYRERSRLVFRSILLQNQNIARGFHFYKDETGTRLAGSVDISASGAVLEAP